MNRTIKTIMLFVALCCSLCMSAAASGYPVDIQFPDAPGDPVCKIYLVSSEKEVQQLPQEDFSFAGEQYALQDVTVQQEGATLRCTLLFYPANSSDAALPSTVIWLSAILLLIVAAFFALKKLVPVSKQAYNTTEVKEISTAAAESMTETAAVAKPQSEPQIPNGPTPESTKQSEKWKTSKKQEEPPKSDRKAAVEEPPASAAEESAEGIPANVGKPPDTKIEDEFMDYPDFS